MKSEMRLYGDLDDAAFVATDGYLVIWSALMWALGAATAYASLLL